MKYFNIMAIFILTFTTFSFPQNVTLNDTIHIVYGALTYNGQTVFVTDDGLHVTDSGNYSSNRNSTNEQFSRYYKMIYGEDAENPNFVIDGENIGFIPFVNINELYGNNKEIIEGITVSDFAKAFGNENFEGRERVVKGLKGYLSNVKGKK